MTVDESIVAGTGVVGVVAAVNQFGAVDVLGVFSVIRACRRTAVEVTTAGVVVRSLALNRAGLVVCGGGGERVNAEVVKVEVELVHA